MKKVFYSVLIFCFISCSDESKENLNNDTIVGTWQLFSSFVNGIEETNDCLKKSQFTFFNDGKITGEVVIKNNSNTCVSDDGEQTGTWTKTGTTNEYNLNFPPQTKVIKLTLMNDNTFIVNEGSETKTTYHKK